MTPAKQRTLILVAAGTSGILGVAALGWLVWNTLQSVTHPKPATEADRKLVITIEALERFGAAKPRGRGSMHVVRQIDGSRDITYMYDGRDSASRGSISMLSKAQVLPQSLTAMQVYKLEQFAIRTGARVGSRGKTAFVERPDLVTFGDQHYAALIVRDGKPIGNFFVIRQGRVVQTLSMTGFYLEEPKNVEELFAAAVAEAKKQTR